MSRKFLKSHNFIWHYSNIYIYFVLNFAWSSLFVLNFKRVYFFTKILKTFHSISFCQLSLTFILSISNKDIYNLNSPTPLYWLNYQIISRYIIISRDIILLLFISLLEFVLSWKFNMSTKHSWMIRPSIYKIPIQA